MIYVLIIERNGVLNKQKNANNGITLSLKLGREIPLSVFAIRGNI